MKLTLIIMLGFLSFFASAKSGSVPRSIYDFKVAALMGGTIDFSKYKGKKILIVNTASKCGNTPQYADLEALYKKYKNKMVIIGFPANDFGRQEPGTNTEIAEFCQKNYSVSFPMAAKITVKGDDMAPVYQWLTQKKYNDLQDSEVQWNFQKYLINENGQLVAVFNPKTQPMSPEIIAAIEK
jgi:glutathione peroxidase